jgi:competence protein ComEA
LTGDERRALAVVALALSVAAAARLRPAPPPVVPAPALDTAVQADSARSKQRRAQQAARPLKPGELIDVNSADVIELQRLPGIGPALAARVVAYRDSVGRFHDRDELIHVRGIGPKLLARIRDLIALGP